MSKVKICGLQRLCDIEYANQLQPDYIGFVFAPHSKRYISLQQGGNLREKLSPMIRAVGVFVNEPLESLLQIAEICQLDLIQLHGQEDDTYLQNLRAKTKLPLIQAFRVESEKDVDLANRSSADYVLLDNGGGGTGNAFNWSLLKEMNRPYFLAGGLNSENVAAAVAKFSPYGVDVSSGVEINGRKDFEKMQSFITAVRENKGKKE